MSQEETANVSVVALHGPWIAIFMVALGLRIWGGVTYGLPYLYDPDESAFVSPALKMVWDSNPNPGWFGHPGSTVIYLNAALFKLLSLAAPHLGLFDSMRGFRRAFLNDPSLVYVLARSLYVLIGAGTVCLLYALARQVYGRAAACLAASMLAVMALHVEFSQLVRTDIIVTALVVLAGHQAIGVLRDRSLRRYVWSGVLVGVAVATKYPAVLIGSMILVAHLLVEGLRWRSWWKLAASGAAALVSLFVCSPFLFIDHATVQRDLEAEAAGGHLSAAGHGFWSNLTWYLDVPLEGIFGWGGLGLALVAVVMTVRQRRADVTVLVSFVFAYCLAISTLSLRWERWIIPILPFVAMFVAGGASMVASKLGERLPFGTRKVWLLLLCAVLLAPLLVQTVTQGMNRTRSDTRAMAREWLMTHVPPGSRMLIETYGPQVPKDRYQLFNSVGLGVVQRPQGVRAHVIPSGFLGETATPDALTNAGVEYIVLSSFHDRFKAMNQPDFLNLVANYERVLLSGELVAEFLPVTGRSANPLKANNEGGPYLRILKLPLAPKPTP